MRYAVIACSVFMREISRVISESENTCIAYWIDQGLHNTPTKLRDEIQNIINRIDEKQKSTHILDMKKYDAILLGLGLCSNGIVGLSSSELPIIAPKCDDCMAMFLGSQQRYLDIFNSRNGTYWYNSGWTEVGNVPSEKFYNTVYKYYCNEYGEDNAEFLMEAENGWKINYNNCVFINSPFYNDEKFVKIARKAADYFNWEFVQVEGSAEYINNLLNGNWDETAFLTVPPSKKIAAAYDGSKICVGD